MKLYLDDDSVARLLVLKLQQAGHDVQIPRDLGLHGMHDAVHFLQAIREQRVLISGNHDDFENLHNLIVEAGGGHSGVFIIRKDRDYRRDMSPDRICYAISNIVAAGIQVSNEFIILNHWR